MAGYSWFAFTQTTVPLPAADFWLARLYSLKRLVLFGHVLHLPRSKTHLIHPAGDLHHRAYLNLAALVKLLFPDQPAETDMPPRLLQNCP
jgi:hypothetical protein